MKRIKRIMNAALAMAIAAAMPLTAFAAPDGPTGSLEYDNSITIGGLQENDSVTFYKVLEWDDGWKTTDAFDSMSGNLDEIAHGSVVTNEDGTEKTVVTGGISFELAGQIGSIVSGGNVEAFETVTATGGAVSIVQPKLEPGLYMAIISSETPGYFYNPVFVAADFNPDNTVLTLSETELSYSDKARAKLNIITLEKTSPEITADVGDTVHFSIDTMVPMYAANYIDPVFKLTDVLSDGLTVDKGSVAVEGMDADAYAVAYNEDGSGYVLTVSPEYLKSTERTMTAGVTGTPIKVTYTATVTSNAEFSINADDNTVTLQFSNHPNDDTGYGVLRDRTNHYTFDIDGLLFGSDGYQTSEVVKVGVDANGNEITKETVLSNGYSIGALEGAKFTLYKADDEGNMTGDVYANPRFNGAEIVSDASGHIGLTGLDAGIYYLVETEAPAGYIKSQDAVKIEIEATEGEVTVEDEEVDVDGTVVKVTYKVPVLTDYHVYVTVGENGDRVETASYELKNTGADLASVEAGDKVGSDELGWGGKIINTVGVELPSTGGIGTTIFYAVGATLVIGAGVLLVVKKRVGRKE